MALAKKTFIISMGLLCAMVVWQTRVCTAWAQNTNTAKTNANLAKNANVTSNANLANNTSVQVKTVLDYDSASSSLDNLLSFKSLPDILVYLLKFILMAIGIVALISILIAAFRLVTSQGNSTTITAAKKTIQWAILGLVLALMSYSIVAILQSLLGL